MAIFCGLWPAAAVDAPVPAKPPTATAKLALSDPDDAVRFGQEVVFKVPAGKVDGLFPSGRKLSIVPDEKGESALEITGARLWIEGDQQLALEFLGAKPGSLGWVLVTIRIPVPAELKARTFDSAAEQEAVAKRIALLQRWTTGGIFKKKVPMTLELDVTLRGGDEPLPPAAETKTLVAADPVWLAISGRAIPGWSAFVLVVGLAIAGYVVATTRVLYDAQPVQDTPTPQQTQAATEATLRTEAEQKRIAERLTELKTALADQENRMAAARTVAGEKRAFATNQTRLAAEARARLDAARGTSDEAQLQAAAQAAQADAAQAEKAAADAEARVSAVAQDPQLPADVAAAAALLATLSTALVKAKADEQNMGWRWQYSLSRVQGLVWLLVVFFGSVFVYATTGSVLGVMNPTALALLAIGCGTTFVGLLLDESRESSPATAATVPAPPPGVNPWRPGITTLLADMLDSNGSGILHRLQIVIWTVFLVFTYLSALLTTFVLPTFDSTMFGLMGVSAATYLGFKAKEKDTPPKKP